MAGSRSTALVGVTARRRDAALRLAEVLGVFAVAWAVIAAGGPLAGDGFLARQAVVWVANVGMLVTIWGGLRLRGQGWTHLGVAFAVPSFGRALRVVVRGVVVAVLALVAFVVGAVVMTALASEPQAADTSGYGYLQGNPGGLLLALVGVYIVSSFGEEVVYRGFLMTRLAELGGRTRAAWGASLVAGAVVFGLAHYAWGPAGMVQTGFMGLVLGAAYLHHDRNLWVPIVAHGIMDTLLLVQVYLG